LTFAAIETFGAILSWRVYGKRMMIAKNLEILRSNHFPPRRYRHDDFSTYLYRIEDDADCSAAAKKAAVQMTAVLTIFSGMGVLAGMRMHSAADAAFELFSPSSAAPSFGEPIHSP
jgi:hypothetical protein